MVRVFANADRNCAIVVAIAKPDWLRALWGSPFKIRFACWITLCLRDRQTFRSASDKSDGFWPVLDIRTLPAPALNLMQTLTYLWSQIACNNVIAFHCLLWTVPKWTQMRNTNRDSTDRWLNHVQTHLLPRELNVAINNRFETLQRKTMQWPVQWTYWNLDSKSRFCCTNVFQWLNQKI